MRLLSDLHSEGTAWAVNVFGMPVALGTAPVIVAGAVEAAFALPSAKQINGVSAEAADQVFIGKLAVAPGGRDSHTDVVVEVEKKPRPQDHADDSADAADRAFVEVGDFFGAAFNVRLDVFSHCHTLEHQAGSSA